MTRQDLEKRCEELAHVYAIERHQHRQHPQYGFTAMTFREAFTAALNLTWPMVEEREAELSAWKEVELASGRTRKEIYGMANKLKPGRYGKPPLPDIPTCSMTPDSVKIHDDICDALESHAYNEDDVCTASSGIWAAIGVCEKMWRDPLRAEAERLAQALESTMGLGVFCGFTTDVLEKYRAKFPKE